MDPLSVITAAFTLLGVVSASVKILMGIKDRPAQLGALADDIDALGFILKEIEPLLKDTKYEGQLQGSRLPQMIFSAYSSRREVRKNPWHDSLQAISEPRPPSASAENNPNQLDGYAGRIHSVRSTTIPEETPVLTVHPRSKAISIQSSVEDSARTAQKFEDTVLAAFLNHQTILQGVYDLVQAVFSRDTDNTVPIATSSALATSRQRSRGTDQLACHTVRVARPRRCIDSCICGCHHALRIRTPEVIRNAVGVLFIELALLSVFFSCRQRTCRHRSQRLLRFTYYFPQWLLMRMICVTLYAPDPQAWNVSCKTPRRVSEDAAVFECARSGDIDGVRSLFDRGMASVYDIGITTGACAITVNSSNQATADIAWNKVLAGSVPEDCMAAIREDFDETEYFESRRSR
ncbi:hypothetical protein O1611_g10492 [Lasiodiplodia mahajangana]|uniref:Uncharacterized protein n=1 Tax=Lasiodiplodia mahajangana TaxID=1108764 RepID=A0ACC2IXS1_9PEZI|nr:hypothetical protein O1611_g10492 [Lasiodiplodia mahajangana]